MASSITERARAALKNAFIGDALAMPVHWFYNPADIYKAFPLGIEQFEDAPTFHPSSIMSLHSTQQGGRANKASASQNEIVGEVILKGKRQYWGKDNVHYHQGMKAGENTLNAHCARIVLICALKGYDANEFLNQYINFMRADEPKHSDTYAESYHRGFFANLEQGIPAEKCGAVTHDTASIGAFVSVTPLAIVEAAKNTALNEIQQLCRKHLYLTHPDESLASVCDVYVELIYKLAHREHESPKDILDEVARNSAGLNLSSLMAKNKSDIEVVGRMYSPACYISDAWPAVLYSAYRYADNPKKALMANTNVGGDNVHRGFVLGAILGLMHGAEIMPWFSELTDTKKLNSLIDSLAEE